MENPGKIGHKTHHEDNKKKQRYILFTRWQFQRFIFFSLKYYAFRRH